MHEEEGMRKVRAWQGERDKGVGERKWYMRTDRAGESRSKAKISRDKKRLKHEERQRAR